MLRWKPLIALIALPAVAACAADNVAYPSLAKRDAERIANTPVPAASTAPAPAADPGLDARLAGMVARAEAAHAKFISHRSRAESLTSAASGAAMGGEAWAMATVAVSQLESARSEAMVVLADLDQAYAAAVVAGVPTAAMEAARNRILELVMAEDHILAALSKRLAG